MTFLSPAPRIPSTHKRREILLPPDCSVCGMAPATVSAWLGHPAIAVKHPVMPHLCDSCLAGETPDEFWAKIGARAGFLEWVPPYSINYFPRLSLRDVEQVLAVWKEGKEVDWDSLGK